MADGIRKFSPVRMTASSEEAAVQQALMLVGASREEVEVEVVEQNAKGVTVRIKPRSEASAAVAPVAAEPIVTEAPAPKPALEPALEPAPEPATPEDVPEARHEVEAPILESPEVVESAVAETTDEAPSEAEQPSRSQQTPLQELDEASLERARATAQAMLDRMGMTAQVRVEDSSDMGRTHLQIEGEDVGILIGKHGQTLQSFQYLLNLTLNNKAPQGEEGLRLVVDAGGYRTRRAASLEQTAQSAAARAKRDRRSVRLEPMPAYERRLIHMALAEEAGISTSSEGREPQRHVVVTPAGARPEENREGRFAGRGQGGFGGFGGRGGGNSGPGGGSGGGGYGNRRGGQRNYGR